MTKFVTSPAGLLDKLTPDWMNGTFWAIVILAYYLLATLLPIDKLIGKLYPFFGIYDGSQPDLYSYGSRGLQA